MAARCGDTRTKLCLLTSLVFIVLLLRHEKWSALC